MTDRAGADEARELRIKVLGWILLVLGGGCLAIGLFICASLAADPSDKALYYIGPFFGMLSTFYFVPSVIGGYGLIKGWSWARVVVGALSVLLILSILGLPLGVFGLWVVFTGKTPKPPPKPFAEPAAVAAETRRVRGVILVAAVVGLSFIVFIGMGFKISGDAAPPVLMSLLWPSTALLAAILIYMFLKRPFAEFPNMPRENPFEAFALRQQGRRQTRIATTEYEARLARLDADPVRRTYAARMRMGEWWSDEDIAYDLDRDRLITCRHLQPIERAMRDMGFTVKPLADNTVNCDCRVDEASLIEDFDLPEGVGYREYFRGGISVHDFPTAQIDCTQHGSTIFVVHGLEARAQTPWFPRPPA